jgi:uncharacterized protein YaiI (UPF0178 family)
MKIFVDADSCPAAARNVIIRAAQRTGLAADFAANRVIPIPESPSFVMELCPDSPDAADDRIVSLAQKGDLAITRDVGLAKRLVENNVNVLDDRGRLFTKDNIGELYSIRCFRVGLAESGAEIVRTAAYGKKELKLFADSFDRILNSNHG